ncbi:MAG TPA: hypothetical protein DCE56_43265 [Cyanobacteria bacterium UBA8553]|nr:hypothetical protein [Cyanobacteria bacterium UBA8553]HAJ58771.1 hypothetical protein [Cyanobacteria bacterium UBA8543]
MREKYGLFLLVLLLVLNGNYMNKSDEEFEWRLRPRETETVSIEIPSDTLESLKKVATSRDMSMEALLKFYICSTITSLCALLIYWLTCSRTPLNRRRR